MDLAKVLAELHAELDNLNAAIISLERIEQGRRRRGRPPEWMNKTRSVGAPGELLLPEEKPKTGRREPAVSENDE
jgi:hypothetical protein